MAEISEAERRRIDRELREMVPDLAGSAPAEAFDSAAEIGRHLERQLAERFLAERGPAAAADFAHEVRDPGTPIGEEFAALKAVISRFNEMIGEIGALGMAAAMKGEPLDVVAVQRVVAQELEEVEENARERARAPVRTGQHGQDSAG